MKLLLDTHVFLWLFAFPDRISRKTKAAIGAAKLFVSAVTAWELATKAAAGKLTLPASPEDYFDERVRGAGMTEVPITARHALVAGALPPIHRDPFDRMLVAQALEEQMTFLTADERLAGYGVDILRP